MAIVQAFLPAYFNFLLFVEISGIGGRDHLYH